MIHLANDPNASRMGHRPAQSDGEGRGFDHPRSRAGRAWPFLTHLPGRPVPQDPLKSASSDSGS
jgi:hypothetical protein